MQFVRYRSWVRLAFRRSPSSRFTERGCHASLGTVLNGMANMQGYIVSNVNGTIINSPCGKRRG